MNLSKNSTAKRIMNAVASGTSEQTSSTIDMTGYEGVEFIVLLGAITASCIPFLRARQGKQSDMSDGADLKGTKNAVGADTDDNKMLVSDLYRPRERYVDVVIDRSTGTGCAIDGIVAILYEPNDLPAPVDADVFQETHVSPEEGTA